MSKQKAVVVLLAIVFLITIASVPATARIVVKSSGYPPGYGTSFSMAMIYTQMQNADQLQAEPTALQMMNERKREMLERSGNYENFREHIREMNENIRGRPSIDNEAPSGGEHHHTKNATTEPQWRKVN